MSEIKKEKLGFIEKLLGSIGKIYMWFKAKKCNKLLAHLGHLYSVYELAKLTGSYEKALEDIKVILNSSWYAFLGKEKIDYFEYVPPDENGVEKIIWRCNKCMLCSGIDEDIFIKDDLEKIESSLASLLLGIFESFFGIIMEYAGRSFDIKVYETKCMAKGDPYQEITAVFTPKKSENE